MTASRSDLRAAPGDRFVIRAHHTGEDAEILKALGPAGSPPFLVPWSDDGHVSRVYPGPDAFVDRLKHASAQ